jgi:hypothetical protein
MLNTGHSYGTIADTVDVVTTGRKGKNLNILERYHIYKISKDNLQMNDTPYSRHYTRQHHTHRQLRYTPRRTFIGLHTQDDKQHYYIGRVKILQAKGYTSV